MNDQFESKIIDLCVACRAQTGTVALENFAIAPLFRGSLRIPDGFQAAIILPFDSPMSDGIRVPELHDCMTAWDALVMKINSLVRQ